MNMKLNKWVSLALALPLTFLSSCGDLLTETNQNPNEVDPSVANQNMIMPSIMAPAATSYLQLNFEDIAGTIQHIQHDGWIGSVNNYDWSPRDWTEYYNRLRDAELLKRSPHKFHQGVALTMRAFQYGLIADYWGDAPYKNALKAGEGIWKPEFDTQEDIYKGIIEELKEAAALFATGDNSGYLTNYDTYYGGDTKKWHQFANSLLLRYYMRLSVKLPDYAKAGFEQVYASGVYIKSSADDAAITFVGSSANNNWPFLYYMDDSGQSQFRRKKPAKTFIDQLVSTKDPRLTTWWAPVHVQWVADPTLTTPTDPFIRKNGQLVNGVPYLTDRELKAQIAEGAKFTKHFNPTLYAAANNGATLDTSLFVGVPIGLFEPSEFNGNLTPGQVVENQHASQMSDPYRYSNKPSILKSKIIHAAEVGFLLAEAAQRGWNVGDAKTHYENAIKLSLGAWEVSDGYEDFIKQPNVAYDGTLERIITQKWVASWSCGSEAWMDFRRTGIPALKAGISAAKPAVAVRFIYGNAEGAANTENFNAAVDRLEQTPFAAQKNSQWSKPWVLQGTGKPW